MDPQVPISDWLYEYLITISHQPHTYTALLHTSLQQRLHIMVSFRIATTYHLLIVSQAILPEFSIQMRCAGMLEELPTAQAFESTCQETPSPR